MSAWVVYTGHNDFGNTYFHQRYSGWSSAMEAYLLVGVQKLAIYQYFLTSHHDTFQKMLQNPIHTKQFSGPHITEDRKIRKASSILSKT